MKSNTALAPNAVNPSSGNEFVGETPPLTLRQWSADWMLEQDDLLENLSSYVQIAAPPAASSEAESYLIV